MHRYSITFRQPRPVCQEPQYPVGRRTQWRSRSGVSADAPSEVFLHGALGHLASESRRSKYLHISALDVKLWRLKREGIEIHEFTPSLSCLELKRIHQPRTLFPSAVLRRNPKLLQFTALAPSSANGSTADRSVMISGDYMQCFHLMKRAARNTVLVKPCVDDRQRFRRSWCMNRDQGGHSVSLPPNDMHQLRGEVAVALRMQGK